MLYVVEIPYEGRPKSWFAFDQDDLMRKIHAEKVEPYPIIYDTTTVSQQLAKLGTNSGDPKVDEERNQLLNLAEQHGLETVLYRADYLLGTEVYQVEAVSELDACITALATDLKYCRIFSSETAAVNALYNDPIFHPEAEFYNHMALREQLIAMEVISDDL